MSVLTTQEVASVLNHLIKADRDVCEEFKIASRDARSISVQRALTEFARGSRSRVRELQTVVSGLGESAAMEGTLGSWLHRGWTNFRNRFSRQSEHAILEYCMTYLESAIDNYLDALDQDLPNVVRTIVEREFADMRAAHDLIDAELSASFAHVAIDQVTGHP